MARVLVIDDEHNIRMMIRIALQHAGHTVETADDGQAGLDRFGDGSDWDLVLLDQRMPGIEGLTVLRQLRYHRPDARTIMITAYGTIDLAVEAMKAGATDFLRKPFTADVLRGAVDAALGEGGRKHKNDAAVREPVLTFGSTTINGYRIEFQPGIGIKIGEAIGFPFEVRNPAGESRTCTVTLSPVVIELVKAHADRENMPGGNRFWQALTEEVLANYLYQNADFPPEGLLRVDDYSPGMRRFVDSILPIVS